MNKGRSIHAAAATEGLYACAFINPVIRGAICDPKLGPPEDHPNSPFFEAAEWYLTCRQVAHAGDTFSTYCQNILAEILVADPVTWALVKRHFSSKSDPAKTIGRLRIQREIDTNAREALRESLKIHWCSEVEIIVELRNRIVHQSGMDPEGKVPDTIKRFPPGQQVIYPVALDPNEFPVAWDESGKLTIDAKTANWATHHVLHHIELMDQTICHRFGVPRRRRPTPKISFSMREGSTVFSFFPDKPLPKSQPQSLIPESADLTLPSFPTYDSMANPEEIACAKKWHETFLKIHEFVQAVCSEQGVDMRGFDGRLAGSLLPHTIEGHDHNLGYQLSFSGRPGDPPKFLGIRLRQEKFEPYVTAWGTHAQMRDFRPCELTDELKSYIQDCIGHAVSR